MADESARNFACDDNIDMAIALRDFFYSTNAEMLAEAVSALPGAYPLSRVDARSLEYEFNKLFVGPDSVIAPPYASVYLEKEPRLMGECTLQIRSLYRAFGLVTPDGGNPDDFLAYELETWLILNELANENNDKNAILAFQWLNTHLAAWLPKFIDRLPDEHVSAPIRLAVRLLRKWLALVVMPSCGSGTNIFKGQATW